MEGEDIVSGDGGGESSALDDVVSNTPKGDVRLRPEEYGAVCVKSLS